MADVPLNDLQGAEHAFSRVKDEIEALTLEDLAPMNVDVVTATSLVLGVADRVLTYRERMACLPEFNIRHVDNLVDYALAAWHVYVTNLPEPEPSDAALLIEEVAALRSKMLMWAAPLVGAGVFEEAAYNKIKEGSGHKDMASDAVALVGLYRSKWDRVKGMCGVTEEDLKRGAEIGPAVFAIVSRREQKASAAVTDGSERVHRAWTLLDRAYSQCRRALQFLRYDEGDADAIAPSLRRNQGTRRPGSSATAAADSAAAGDSAGSVVNSGAQAAAAAPPVTGPVLGGGASPFVAQ